VGFDYTPLPDTRHAEDRVKAPGILLLVVSGINLLCQLAAIFLIMVQDGPWRLPGSTPEAERLAQLLAGGLGLLLFGGGIVASVFVIFASVRMLQLRSWGVAMTGSIVATTCLIPWICCCCVPIGLPFGIYAIVVLQDPGVKAAFR
jgi:hypothetical protein